MLRSKLTRFSIGLCENFHVRKLGCFKTVFKAMPSLTFFLAGSLALCLIFCGCTAFSEETTLELENEGAASNSEQLNYWSEEQDGKEVGEGISHETAREMRDVAELENANDGLTQEHHEGKNTS